MVRMNYLTVATLAVTGAVIASSSSHASSVVSISSDSANSTEGLGQFTGTLEYDAVDSQLMVMLVNTSTAANGGLITGFVFNIASQDPNASATLRTDNPFGPTHPFQNLTGNGLKAPPFSSGNQRFDAGAALGGSWTGGGSPQAGISIGETGMFTFDVDATDSSNLVAINFLTGGPFEFNFAVRFKGFNDGGSDKVPGNFSVVPAPAAVWLGIAGLGVCHVSRRRRC